MRNILKSCTNCGIETSLRPFFKKSKLSISLNQHPEVLYSLVSLHVQAEDIQNILKLRCQPLAYTSSKTFLRNKRTCLHASFSV